jgi:UDP-N-acetylglucosamine 2-epimerase (non-hydrolysing)
MIHILHVVGARPNFMKLAPVMRALHKYDHISQLLVHTGQHYASNMSDIFFQQLGVPQPDVNLEVGSGTHTEQTAKIMTRFEKVLLDKKPDLVLVYGDVNSTVAAALVCAKLCIPVGHVEAGLRSNDRTMPEEINRLVTDQLSNLLFTPSLDANANLDREGIDPKNVYFVGNVMIDSLMRLLPQADAHAFDDLPTNYVLVTLHRPSNVDAPERLKPILESIVSVSRIIPVLFPIHPRTQQRLRDFDLDFDTHYPIRLMPPVGYIEFLALQRRASIVITDSGGVQEETTFLGIPCLTLRDNTERPVTVSIGTNKLLGNNIDMITNEVASILAGHFKPNSIPDLWDGHAGDRIASIIAKFKA